MDGGLRGSARPQPIARPSFDPPHSSPQLEYSHHHHRSDHGTTTTTPLHHHHPSNSAGCCVHVCVSPLPPFPHGSTPAVGIPPMALNARETPTHPPSAPPPTLTHKPYITCRSIPPESYDTAASSPAREDSDGLGDRGEHWCGVVVVCGVCVCGV